MGRPTRPSSRPAHHRPDVATLPCSGRSPQSQWAIRPYRRHCGRSILDRTEVALGMEKELSEMPEITLEDYQRVDRQLERKRARRGFTIHAIIYAVVLT